MLGQMGFDQWAERYDQDVRASDEENSYPFAGHRAVLDGIFDRIMDRGGGTVLDLGLGTGELAGRLYGEGCEIYGQDLSLEMLKVAWAKMPGAVLFQGDLDEGLALELYERRYDAVTATYALHHLEPERQADLLCSLLSLLKPGGRIYVGDVAFETAEERERCREQAGDEWDEEEFYFIYEDWKERFPRSSFTKCSHCAGILEIWDADE